MPTDECPHGHLIRSAADRLPNGYCRQCQRDQNRRQRQKTKDKLRAAEDLVIALERYGVLVDPDTLELIYAPGEANTEAPEVLAQKMNDRFGGLID